MAVVVEYERQQGGNVNHFAINARAMPELRIDLSALPQEDRNQEHYGARFLCLAALACYTNTFANALTRNGATIETMTASATIHKEKDEIFRTRYMQIDLSMQVKVGEGQEAIFDAVREELEMGSLVTYSLPEGIQMDYDIQRV